MSDTQIATPVKEAIDAAILADGGNLYRKYLGEIMPTLDDAYRQNKAKFRGHMGASLQGDPCARAIWYSWHWYTVPNFSARLQRLFNRGHLEEGRFMALLKMVGCEIHQYDANGKQFRISASAGHFGGSGDGVLRRVPGLPPDIFVLSEFKTHNDSSFKKLVKEGVKVAKPEHYVQMQLYMDKMDLPIGLYGAVNKNDDDLHWEYIARNKECAAQYLERADKIVWMKKAPVRTGNNPTPGQYACRFCDHKPVCWQGAAPNKNCRSCVHGTPTDAGGGQWVCGKYGGFVLSAEQQETGCQTWEENKQ